MNKRIVTWAIVVLLVAFAVWKLHTSHFDWDGFWRACRQVRWPLVVLATLIIYTNAVVRALRWSIFLKPSLPPAERQPWYTLIGSQFIGFAGLAIFGRVGELIRPYLVSRRVGLPFSSQVAVVAVERIFDLAAFGLLFAGNLLISPELSSLPYHERFHQFGYAIAGMTGVLILFVLSVRLAGATVARIAGKVFGAISRNAGDAASTKILEFRDGLNTIGSVGDFLSIALISLFLWITVALAYIVTMRAFPSPVHELTVSHCLLLMGFSIVGGIVTLPGIGGGAQALTIGALTRLFHVPAELAASVAIIMFLVTTLNILLPGLIYAQVESVNLRSVARDAQAGNA